MFLRGKKPWIDTFKESASAKLAFLFLFPLQICTMKYRLGLFSGASVLKYSVHNHNLHYGIRECLHPIKDVTTNVKVSTFLRVISFAWFNKHGHWSRWQTHCKRTQSSSRIRKLRHSFVSTAVLKPARSCQKDSKLHFREKPIKAIYSLLLKQMWAMLGLRPAPKGIRLRIKSNYNAVSSEVKKSIMMQMINKLRWIVCSVQQKENII